jgi:hypothetical protein
MLLIHRFLRIDIFLVQVLDSYYYKYKLKNHYYENCKFKHRKKEQRKISFYKFHQY